MIGLSCAWRAARAGCGSACSTRALGRRRAPPALPPGCSPRRRGDSWGEEALLDLSRSSLAMWDSFASELEAESGEQRPGSRPVERSTSPSTATRPRSCAAASTCTTATSSARSGCARPACRELEPALSPQVAGGLHAPGEAAADPVSLASALVAAVRARGGEVELGAEIEAADLSGDGVELTLTDGRTLRGERLVVAAGCLERTASGCPEASAPGAAGEGRDPHPARGPRRPGLQRDRRGRARLPGPARRTAGCWSARPSRTGASIAPSRPAGSTSCCARPTA